MPIDFDGNWPEMNLRPLAAPLHGIRVAPLNLGVGLPQVVAFLLLLLDSADTNFEATLLLLGAGKSPPTTAGHRRGEIDRMGGVLDTIGPEQRPLG